MVIASALGVRLFPYTLPTANNTGDEREETSGTKAIYHDECYEWGDTRRRGPNSEHAERVDGQREDQGSDWAN